VPSQARTDAVDAAQVHPSVAIEAETRGQPLAVRRAQRRARAGPLLDEFHEWLLGVLTKVSGKSALAGRYRWRPCAFVRSTR
jgi:hypothetical protein